MDAGLTLTSIRFREKDSGLTFRALNSDVSLVPSEESSSMWQGFLSSQQLVSVENAEFSVTLRNTKNLGVSLTVDQETCELNNELNSLYDSGLCMCH